MIARVALIATLACGCWTGDASPPPATPATPVARPSPPPPPPPVVPESDDQTGFDLYTTPSGVTSWQIDGEVRHDRLPLRIRGIAPGDHEIVIEGPPGYASKTETVTVELGQAPKVMIELAPASP